ncbi:MAG: HAD family hydrolase [Deltaproteobacteria bacterium]|nr:HAD family hydrolase [Deltaproteobacteria bacterium]
MLPKGILIDLDDTILAYSAVAEPIWKKLCQEYAGRMDSIQPERLFGGIKKMSDWFWSDKERHKKGRQDLNSARRFTVSLAFRELKLEDLSLAEEMADRFSAQREEEIFIFEKAEGTLEILTRQNISLALMTNGEAKKQRNKVQRFNLERFFKSILIEGEMGFGKPEEAVYKRAMMELDLGPDEVWAVGDNLEFDVSGPQKLGIFGVWNDFSRQGLPSGSEVIPDRIIYDISELVEEGL